MESNKGGEQKAVAGGRHIHVITWDGGRVLVMHGCEGLDWKSGALSVFWLCMEYKWVERSWFL